MHNLDYVLRHIEHAEYNRDACLASADMARVRYRHYGRHEDFRAWKDNVLQAWRMRRIVKDNHKTLKGE
jgi:hypothetical protein